MNWIFNCIIHLLACILGSTMCKRCLYSELFWSTFSHICTEYGGILRISPYSVRMRENMGQNNSEYGHFLRSAIISSYGGFDNVIFPIFNVTQPFLYFCVNQVNIFLSYHNIAYSKKIWHGFNLGQGKNDIFGVRI